MDIHRERVKNVKPVVVFDKNVDFDDISPGNRSPRGGKKEKIIHGNSYKTFTIINILCLIYCYIWYMYCCRIR